MKKLILAAFGCAILLASADRAPAEVITGQFLLPDNRVLDYELMPFIVSSGAPGFGPNDSNVVVTPPAFDGITRLTINTSGGQFLCTGALLERGGRRFILTAAHCLDIDNNGSNDATSVSATFETTGGNFTVSAANWYLNPDWTGDFFAGNDTAIIELTDEVMGVTAYDLFTGSDDIGQVADLVGYGRAGTGSTGATINPGTKRQAQNLLDADGSALGISSNIGLHDFDNGLQANDAFDVFANLADLGLGDVEGTTAPGDSGGVGLINGQLASVTSFGLRLAFQSGLTSDIDGTLNSTFGEFGGGIRVSTQMDFINSIVPMSTVIPEPGSIVLSAFGGLGLMFGLRRVRRQRQAA